MRIKLKKKKKKRENKEAKVLIQEKKVPKNIFTFQKCCEFKYFMQ